MSKTRKNTKRRSKKGGNGKPHSSVTKNTIKSLQSPNVTVMKNGKTLNFSKLPKNTPSVFIGEPWTAKNTIKHADNSTNFEKPSTYHFLNDYLGSPRDRLISSHNVITPPVVSSPFGYLHNHKHYHPHSPDSLSLIGGKRKKKHTRRKKKKGKKHKKTRNNKMRGGFGKSRFFPGLVNLYRDLENTGENIIRGFMGYPALISPSPLEQPINETVCPPPNIPPNIKSLYEKAQNNVLAI